MLCPSCGQRKTRRQCPALDRAICPVCCGTKRLGEIHCPADCGYLATAREHPAAAVVRRQERDVARLLPTIRHLTERQYQVFFLFQTAIARHVPRGLARLADQDVAEGCAAVAATLETAARGVIYEHAPQGAPAQALAVEITALLAEMRAQGATVYDGEAAIVLRAIEAGARAASVPAEGPRSYLDLVARLLQINAQPGAAAAQDASPSPLILP
jgi:hypothetical protein